jgi:hypothetical protein
MPRPPSYPLPLVGGSKRPSRLRCELCFRVGAAVRVGARLLCGACFHDVALSEEAARGERSSVSSAPSLVSS